MRYNVSMDLSNCRRYLEGLSSIGARVGDFYLAFGRACRPGRAAPEQGAARQCYYNAGMLALENPELAYVEGFGLRPGLIPVHHAWCLDPDGRVVETTWPFDEAAEYWGIPLRTDFLREQVRNSSTWGILAEHIPRDILDLHPSEYLHPAYAPSREEQDAVMARLLRP